MSMTANEMRVRNLRTIGALAALFFLPLLVSFWMYYATDWRPAGSTINGELIDPPRPLPAVQSSAGEMFRDSWTMVYAGDGACDDACRHALLVMRQTRLALNNEMSRVKRAFLATAACCDKQFLEREHEGMVILDAGASADMQALVQQFPVEDRAHMLFVVDPLGNLMMRYDARQNPKGLLQDLKKLLKLSHIG
jgi:hypothetical protein